MTNCRQRMLYGRTSANPPSRFLGEIPEENLEWFGKPEPRIQRNAWEDDESDSSDGGWGDPGASRSGGARSWSDEPQPSTRSEPGSVRGGGSWSSGGVHSHREAKSEPKKTAAAASARKIISTPLMEIRQGDMIVTSLFDLQDILCFSFRWGT